MWLHTIDRRITATLVANHSLMPSYATTRGITAHYGYCTTNAANPYLEAQ